MRIGKANLRPLRLGPSGKTAVRTQFGALCYRVRDDKVQVLLITSKNTGRWIVPKGWPIDGTSPAEAARTEAWEEAGVDGTVFGTCLGIYSYVKSGGGAPRLPCVVAVFPVRVARLATEFPEARKRKRKWFSLKKAAAAVGEPELRRLLQGFDPRDLPR